MTDGRIPAAASLRSILLGSRNPERLRAWYGAALGSEPDADGFLDFDGVSVLIDGRTDVAIRNPAPGRLILSFVVDDASSTAAHLDGLGASWVVEPEDRRDGLFGMLADPDGNYLQIVQPRDEFQASRGG